MQTMEKNRLKQAPPKLRKRIREHLEWLRRQIADSRDGMRQMLERRARSGRSRRICSRPRLGWAMRPR